MLMSATAFVGAPGSAVAAAGSGDFLKIVSQPGDYVGKGATYSYTQNDSVFRQFFGDSSLVFINNGEDWILDFSAPFGGRLKAGTTYTGAGPFFDTAAPYLVITGNGAGCNMTSGSFKVLAVTYASTGMLLSLHITFQQTCVGATAGLSGELFFVAPPVVIPGQNVTYAGGSRSFDLGAFADPNFAAAAPWAVNVSWGDGSSSSFSTSSAGDLGTRSHKYPSGTAATFRPTVRVTNAAGTTSYATFNVRISASTTTPPGSFMYDSQPGESIVHGGTATYTTSNSKFYVTGDTTQWAVTLYPSSGTYPWTIDIFAPAGSTLVPGDYFWASREPIPTTLPGLDVFGDPGCNQLGGAFRVLQATYDSNGSPIRLDATFVQHCEGEVPALTGEIHYSRPATTAPKVKAASNQALPIIAGSAKVSLGSFSDAAGSVDGPWRVSVAWNDGLTDGFIATTTGSLGKLAHTYSKVGVYRPVVTVTNVANLSAQGTDTLAIYDPARSLTGNGSIASGPNSCKLSSTCAVAGTGSFSVSSSYPKGATVPSVAFTYTAPAFSMTASKSGWWLVAIAGSQATLQGAAAVNGASGYTYRLAAADGSPDKLRLQVWNSSRALIYDNGSSEVLSKGSLAVH